MLGLALIVGLDLIEDPNSSLLDVALNLGEELPLLFVGVGAVFFYQALRDQRQENNRIREELDRAVDYGKQWREQARTHLRGLSVAMNDQFERWQFTNAEREIAILLIKGLSTKEIAAARATSDKTVRDHAQALYRKAGLSGRAALAAYFLEDLLPPMPLQLTGQDPNAARPTH